MRKGQAPEPTPRERVVAMYKAGVKLTEITRETGVPRGTIYYLLKEEGINPSRQAQGEVVSEIAHQLADVITERDGLVLSIVELKQEIYQLRREMVMLKYSAALMDRLGIVPPHGKKRWMPEGMELDAVDPESLVIELLPPGKAARTATKQTKRQPSRPRRTA